MNAPSAADERIAARVTGAATTGFLLIGPASRMPITSPRAGSRQAKANRFTMWKLPGSYVGCMLTP